MRQSNRQRDSVDSGTGLQGRIWWLGPLLVLAVVAVLAVASGGREQKDVPSAEDRAGTAQNGSGRDRNRFAAVERREDGDPTALGRADAPVVLIEYADFQCPFCRRFARETEPRLIEEYVNRGLLRIEWRDLPLLGPESRNAAAAARAAAAQGRFWEYHDMLYAEERRVNSGTLDDDALRAIAERIGLDLARFDADRTSTAVLDAIARDEQEATRLGITGTPAFIVGGLPVIGAQPYEVFQQAIDEALAER